MNTVLWVVAAVLAVAFLAAGAMKLTKPRSSLAESGQAWVEDFSDGAVKGIGALEVLAAIGLILPALVDIATVLVPLAATGLVLLMLGAAITHARRREYPNIAVNLVLGALALFVAISRFGGYSL
jgi:uncharacterized membrane protein YphA (DoxX/SURF4 family)